ncbi:hypothetical protein VNO78_03418 [Psophocarpus tetragonolobus]|uniref:Uncharacterized protein n=1 Tax=Psophocarpus tetragonolobus TaxID=3891 RepID=A0AAN9T471_PSOTE
MHVLSEVESEKQDEHLLACPSTLEIETPPTDQDKCGSHLLLSTLPCTVSSLPTIHLCWLYLPHSLHLNNAKAMSLSFIISSSNIRPGTTDVDTRKSTPQQLETFQTLDMQAREGEDMGGGGGGGGGY